MDSKYIQGGMMNIPIGVIDFEEILNKHKLWSEGSPDGVRADLSNMDLPGVVLPHVKLPRANFRGACLHGAYLPNTDLNHSDLSYVDLSLGNLINATLINANMFHVSLINARLSYANLHGAYLRGSKLCGADLFGVDLRDADLRDVDLLGAKLFNADLHGADMRGAKNVPAYVCAIMTVVTEDTKIGWAKLQGGKIAKLEIPLDAKRSNATGRRCRCEYAMVLEVWDGDNQIVEGISKDGTSVYRVGEVVRCYSWDDDRWNQYSGGVDFFITREEALADGYILNVCR